MAEKLNWRLNSSTSTPLTSPHGRSSEDTSCRSFPEEPASSEAAFPRWHGGDMQVLPWLVRTPANVRRQVIQKASRGEHEPGRDRRDTGGWTSGWRFKGGRHAVYSSKNTHTNPAGCHCSNGFTWGCAVTGAMRTSAYPQAEARAPRTTAQKRKLQWRASRLKTVRQEKWVENFCVLFCGPC